MPDHDDAGEPLVLAEQRDPSRGIVHEIREPQLFLGGRGRSALADAAAIVAQRRDTIQRESLGQK